MEIDDDSIWESSIEDTGSPKKGRRAALNKTDLNSVQDRTTDDPSDIAAFMDDAIAPPKPPRRRTDGWSDSSTKIIGRGNRNVAATKGSAFEEADVTSGNDQTDEMTIPDLDEFQEEAMAAQVAKAPQVAVNRVATYNELDVDLSNYSAFATLDSIDLKALTKYLSPESDIREDDSTWTWDSLIADVASAFNRNNDPENMTKK